MPDLDALRRLAATVAAFPVRDRALRRAQKRLEAGLAAGAPADHDVAAYLDATRRYFAGFEREARAQLRYVDRELERVYQRQFNLTAERGVAARRIEVTQGVLSALAELERG